MRDEYTLLTPENVELRYDVAGLGSRLFAAIIDYTILAFGYTLLAGGAGFAFDWVQDSLAALQDAYPALDDYLGYALLAVAVLLLFFGWWGYFLLFDFLWNGQSPGKRMLGLRVVRLGGQPISTTASLVRNLVRAADFFLLIGVVVMLLNRSNRRLGDFAAGTLVVREPRRVGRGRFPTLAIPEVPPERVEALVHADRLSMAHYTLLRDYFARRPALSSAQDQDVARQLANRLGQVIGVPWHEVGDPVIFLAAVLRAFEARRQYYDAQV